MPRTIPRSSAIATALLILVAFGPAQAHQDRRLSLGQDGAIAGLPEKYLPAYLSLERNADGTVVGAVLRLSAGEYTFAQCLLGLFKKYPKIVLSGSWYHSERVLPYYISMQLHDEEKHRRSEAFTFLFDLRTAQLLKVEKIVSEKLSDRQTTTRHEPAFEGMCPGQKMADGWRRGHARPKQ